MRISEIKDALRKITETFFTGAKVEWVDQNTIKPKMPYVTLQNGSVSRNLHVIAGENQERFYNSYFPVTINLYTNGSETSYGDNKTKSYEDSAVSDLLDFFDYLESDAVQDELDANGLTVLLEGPVQNLTGIVKDNRYKYRAMGEMLVNFTHEASGYWGQNRGDGTTGTGGKENTDGNTGGSTGGTTGSNTGSNGRNSSGGGGEPFAEPVPAIEHVEIREKEKEK